MTRNQALPLRALLFILGAGIVTAAFFIFTMGQELNRAAVFTWVSVGIMYILFFAPLFFSSLSVSNFSGKIPSLAMIWTGVFVYIPASVVVIALLFHGMSLRAAVVSQLVLLFLFVVNVYFAFLASSHVKRVAGEEMVQRMFLGEIQAAAQTLSLTVNRLPGGYEGAQRTIKAALEDIRYISPVNGGIGDDAELKIIHTLKMLSELCAGISTEGRPATLEAEANNLQMQVKERKMLRN
jgi:hypothetical protein